MNIDAIGTYVPRYRLEADAVREAWGQFYATGIEATAVPGADEDSLTMAYEAATNALDASQTERAAIERLLVATTTPPTEEEPLTARLTSMLGLNDGVGTQQLTGSTAAGVDAVLGAVDRKQAADQGATLIVASDCPRGEPDSETDHAGGAGAVALVLSAAGSGTISSTATHTEIVPGTRFRPAGERETTGLGITSYDRSAYTTGIAAVIETLDIEPAAIELLAAQAPNGGLPYRAGNAVGVDESVVQRGTAVREVGDCGTASALLGLAHGLSHTDGESPRSVVVGYGSGSASAFTLDGSVPVETGPGDGVLPSEKRREELSYSEYLRMVGEITPGEPSGGGAYVSVPSWKRTLPQRHRLLAGRCRECGSLAFPPTGACSSCGTFEEYDETPLPGTGTVEATTVIGRGGAPPEFVDQQARGGSYTSAIVALDGPEEGASNDEQPEAAGAVSVPMQVVGHGSVSIGDRVEATVRRIYEQEGVIRYGCKMRPRVE